MINNIVSNYVAPFVSSSPVAVASSICCAIPAAEMLVRANMDLAEYVTASQPMNFEQIEERNKRFQEMINHLAGAVLLGGCALNLVPGTALIGTVGFMIYSRFKWVKETNCANPAYSTVYTGLALNILSFYKKELAARGLHLLKKGADATTKIVSQIFHKVSQFIKAIFPTLKNAAKIVGRAFIHMIKYIPKLGSLIIKISSAALRIILKFPLPVATVLLLTILGVRNIEVLTGAASVVGYVAKGVFSAGSLVIGAVPYVVSGGVKAIGFTASGIISIGRFILRV